MPWLGSEFDSVFLPEACANFTLQCTEAGACGFLSSPGLEFRYAEGKKQARVSCSCPTALMFQGSINGCGVHCSDRPIPLSKPSSDHQVTASLRSAQLWCCHYVIPSLIFGRYLISMPCLCVEPAQSLVDTWDGRAFITKTECVFELTGSLLKSLQFLGLYFSMK